MNTKFEKPVIYLLFLYGFFSAISITLAEICFIGALFLWAADVFANKRPPGGEFEIYLAVPAAFFAVVHFTAALAGLDPVNSLVDFKKIYIMLGFFIAARYLKNSFNIKRAVDFLAGGALFVGLYASATGVYFRFIKGEPGFRAASFSGNHMHAGGMLMLALIVVMVFIVYYVKEGKEKKGRLVFLSASACFSAAGLLFTFTRSSWIGACAGLFILVVFSGKRYIMAFALVSIILFFAFRGTPFYKRAMDSFRVAHNTSTMERIHMWRSGIEIIKDYPAFGTGTDNLMKVYPHYSEKRAVEKEIGHLHNNIIQVGVIDGIAGIFAFLWMFFAMWFFFMRGIKQSASLFIKYLRVCGLAASCAFFVNGFFEYNFFSSQVALLFWFITGVSSAAAGEAKGAGGGNRKKTLKTRRAGFWAIRSGKK